MYQRKVQITGGATFFVTLPKVWADKIGLRPGTTVTLMPNDSGALLLIPQRLLGENRCSVVMDDLDYNRLQREIIARYIVGYAVIEVVGKRIRPDQRRTVREIAKALVGLEILEETRKTVVLHSVVNVKDFPVQRTLHRIFDITQAMLNDAVTAFVGHDEELARDVMERDGDVDRLVLLVSRQFSLLLRDLLIEEDAELSRLEFLLCHTVADQLERVADHAAKVSQATLALKAPLKKPIKSKFKEMAVASGTVLARAVQAFEERDTELANHVLEEKERGESLFELERLTSPGGQPEDAHPISIAMDSLLRIREYGFNIAENALDAPATKTTTST